MKYTLVSLGIVAFQLGTQVVAQTVVVQGTIATSATTVRSASVTFQEKLNPANSFVTLTDSLGQFRLNITLTSVHSGTPLPLKFELAQNYPNPFTSSTAISYQLNAQSEIRVTIYDILGRVVRESSPGTQSVGWYTMLWDAKNAQGQRVAPGVYFYRVQA